jgi:iron(III) transport system ATP-binding protein
VKLVLRPEWLRLTPATGGAGVEATVSSIAYAGHDALVTLTLDSGATVRSRVAAPNLPRRGERMLVTVSHPALAYAVAS